MPWIWFGGGVVVLGALIGVLPQRKRRAATVAARQPAPAVPVPLPRPEEARHELEARVDRGGCARSR